MTYGDVCVTMAVKCPYKTKDQWNDFFSMTPDLQALEARLIKAAIFENPNGPSVLGDILVYLDIAAKVVSDVVGLGFGYTALKALL